MNRRQMLQWTGAAGLAASLAARCATRRAHAAGTSRTPKKLVLVMAQGGWDTTYALDPKLQSATVDVPAGAIQHFGNLPVFVDPSRQAVTDYFTKYADQTAVIRGIAVASVSHLECIKRMSTGTREETNPDMGAIVAHDLGNALPMPYLILGDTAFTGAYAVSAGRVGASNQILALLDPAQAYPTNGQAHLDVSKTEQTLLAKFANASADRARATRGALGYNRRRVDDFVEAIGRGERLKTVRAGFGSRGRTLLLADQVDLAVSALAGGISQAVMLNTRLDWDTHTVNDDQAGFHVSTFSGLTRLLDGLAAQPGSAAGHTLLDETVVVCYSEFSRTPTLNANGGKDHWPITSALVAGAGVRGGQAYGATTDDMKTTTVDFTTGAVSASGKTLSHANVIAGVLRLCGAAPEDHLAQTEVFDAFVA